MTSITSRPQLCESFAETRSFAERETSKCEAPKVKTKLVYSRNSKNISVAEIEETSWEISKSFVGQAYWM